MVINYNCAAEYAYKQLNTINKSKSKICEQLSSGYKINRAADNAACLSISEKMRGQIRGLEKASKNIQDGISFVQTADGALSQMISVVHRINELCVKGANDTNVKEDRDIINEEIFALREEIDQICEITEFNGIFPFKGYYSPTVTSSPTDIKIWNVGNGASTAYGGIWYDNIRYTWDDFDKNPIGDDGKLKVGDFSLNVKKKNDAGGFDKITLEFVVKEEGLEPNQITRKYKMTADISKGITIDNTSYSWNEIVNSKGYGLDPDNVEAGNYSFIHAGMNITFSIPEGDAIVDVVNGINGDGLSVFDWTSSFNTVDGPQAVTIQSVKNYPINESTKDFVGYNPQNGSTAPAYYIVADSTGFTVRAANSLTHNTNYTKMTWQELGIVTWDGENTVDKNKTYVYKEQNTGMEIAFNITTEASLEEVVAGLNGANVSSPLLTPTVGTLTSSSSFYNVTSLYYISSKVAFSTQYDYGRNFDNSVWNFNKDGSSSPLIVSGDNMSFTYTNPDGPSLNSITFNASKSSMENTVYNTLRSGILNELNSISNTITFYSGSNSLSLGFNASIRSLKDEFVTEKNSQINTKVNELYTAYYNGLTQAQKDNLTASDISNIKNQYKNSVSSSITNTLINSSKYVNKMNDFAAQTLSEIVNSNCSINLTTKSSAYYTKLSSKELNSPVKVTSFGVRTGDIIRTMNIQAGANSEQNIEIPFKSLNSNVLTLWGITVDSHAKAGDAISKVTKALSILSAEQSKYGAIQNRLEFAMENDDNTGENLQMSESQLRDSDIAKNMIQISKYNILSQITESILSQANNSTHGILQLLQ